MRRLVFIVAILAAFGFPVLVQAEPAGGTNDQTKKPQQGSSSSTDAKPSPKVLDKNDVYWIGPKKPAKPNNPSPPDRGGQLFLFNRFAHLLHGGVSDAMLPFHWVSARQESGARPGARSRAPSDGMVVAEQAVGPKRNSYIIQFKPTATPQQREALLRKYDLVVQRELPSLNIYVVSRRTIPANEPTPEKLSDFFNPPIILNLRREPIIANATVDSASAPRTVPKPSDAKVKDNGGILYQWDWKSGATPPAALSALSSTTQPQVLDGNWGLKAIRMPPVWTILQRFRAGNQNASTPKLAIIDTGFSKHEDLAINVLPTPNKDASADNSVSAATIGDRCNRSHGNHVAGIAGANFGNGVGVDGVIPGAKIDAVPVSDTLISDDPSTTRQENLDDAVGIRAAFFSEVIFAIASYVESERAKNADLRVVNISMGFNIGTLARLGYDVDEIKKAVQDTIANQAQMFLPLALKYEQSILFVIAAGNDSLDVPTPLEAKWSSSIVWLAKGDIDKFLKRPKNILVVEAVDRTGQRAEFSNISGHIAAPGVDIMSTLAAGDDPYDLCSGTSQAAPFAAGVATLLFELSPTKKPAEIIDIMVKSATPKPPGKLGAPQLDALEAVLRLSPYMDARNENLVRLVDLNGDGKVDIEDMKEFARRMAILADNRSNGTPFAEDLNGDGVVDANECNWPLIDFNGSGYGSLTQSDARRLLGEYRNDLAIMQLAWTDKTKDSASAIKETGLDAAIRAADQVNARVSPQACR